MSLSRPTRVAGFIAAAPEQVDDAIKAAKERGVYKGRRPSINAAEVRRVREQERLGPAVIARRLGIGRASVYRVLGERGASA